jgi:hypothetical protein
MKLLTAYNQAGGYNLIAAKDHRVWVSSLEAMLYFWWWKTLTVVSLKNSGVDYED